MNASPKTSNVLHVKSAVPQVHTGLLLGSQSGQREKSGQELLVTSYPVTTGVSHGCPSARQLHEIVHLSRVVQGTATAGAVS